MLLTSDAGVVRRERELPGMGLVLDPEALVERLNTIFVEAGVESAAIQKVHYEPGTGCLAQYEIRAGSKPIRLYAKAYRYEDLARLRGPRIRKATPSAFGPGRVLLAAPAVILYFFPNDHHLRKLPEIFSEALATVFPDHCGGENVKLETAEYIPERRYTGTVTSNGAPKAVVKVFERRALDRAIQSSTVFAERGALRMEPVIGVAPPYNAVLFRWTEGTRLQERIREGTMKRSELEMAVEALEELHRQTEHGHYFWNFASELAAVAETIRCLCPSLGEKAMQMATRLLERLEASQTFVPAHGNWIPENIQTGRRRVTLLNLESAALAPPALDSGTFLGYLERQVIYGELPAKQAAAISEMLIRQCTATGRLDQADCEFFAAYALFRNATEPFSHRSNDWSEKTEMILSRAEQLMEPKSAGVNQQSRANGLLKTALGRVASRLRGVRITDPYGVSSDTAMPFLETAIQPDEIARRIATAFPQRFGELKLSEIEVKQYRPGKRCVVDYEWLEGNESLGITGIMEAEPQENIFHTHQALWTGSFAPGNEDDARVAEPLGYLPELHMRLQSQPAGAPASQLLAESEGPSLARRVALVLHRLHHSSAPPPRKYRLQDELNLLRDHLTGAARIRPPWAARLDRILETCQKLVSATPEPEPCLIHVNFYPEHLLVEGNSISLLELDGVAEGNPALDAGAMLAAIKEIALRTFGDADAMLSCEEEFRETYLELSGRPLRQPIKTFTTLNLAHQIYYSTLSAERSLCTADLIDLCEKRLDIVSKNAAPSTRAVFKVR